MYLDKQLGFTSAESCLDYLFKYSLLTEPPLPAVIFNASSLPQWVIFNFVHKLGELGQEEELNHPLF